MPGFERSARRRRHVHHADVMAIRGEQARRHSVAKTHGRDDILVHLGIAIVIR